MSFLTQPASSFQLLQTIITSPTFPPIGSGGFVQMDAFGSSYTSFMITATQLATNNAGDNLQLQFVDQNGVAGNIVCTTSNSFFTGLIETNVLNAATSAPQPISDGWGADFVCQGNLVMYLDNILLGSGVTGIHPSFNGLCTVPKTAPSDCVLTDKFSGCINQFAGGKTPAGVRFSFTAGGFHGIFKLYGLK